MSSMLLAMAAAASQVPAATAEQVLAAEKAIVSTAPPKQSIDCPQASDAEIVVCRKQEEDPAKQYVPSDVDNGVPDHDIPRAPQDSMLPPCINAGLALCAQHVGKMRVHPLIIDVKAIPEPPAGSEADRMAKGEIPTP